MAFIRENMAMFKTIQPKSLPVNTIELDSPSILLLEEESAFCTVMGIILNYHGYQVKHIDSPDAAAQSLNFDPPDLILIDVVNQGDDGLYWLKKIRAQEKWSCIPAVIVSTPGGISTIEEAKQAGADGFLPKPFSLSELQGTIAPLLCANCNEGNSPIRGWSRASSTELPIFPGMRPGQDRRKLPNQYEFTGVR
jgi:two-component system, chemotaxis family, chemotaxis protein CheY